MPHKHLITILSSQVSNPKSMHDLQVSMIIRKTSPYLYEISQLFITHYNSNNTNTKKLHKHKTSILEVFPIIQHVFSCIAMR